VVSGYELFCFAKNIKNILKKHTNTSLVNLYKIPSFTPLVTACVSTHVLPTLLRFLSDFVPSPTPPSLSLTFPLPSSSLTSSSSAKEPVAPKSLSTTTSDITASDRVVTFEVLTESALTFARLVHQDEKLQIAAMESDAVEKLARVAIGLCTSDYRSIDATADGAGHVNGFGLGAGGAKSKIDGVVKDVSVFPEGEFISAQRKKVLAVSVHG
jgi:hypothetical protein